MSAQPIDDREELRRWVTKVAIARAGGDRDNVARCVSALAEGVLRLALKRQVPEPIYDRALQAVLKGKQRRPTLGDYVQVYAMCQPDPSCRLPTVDLGLIRRLPLVRNAGQHFGLSEPENLTSPVEVYVEAIRPLALAIEVFDDEELTALEHGPTDLPVRLTLDRVPQREELSGFLRDARGRDRRLIALWLEGETRQGVRTYYERICHELAEQRITIEQQIEGEDGSAAGRGVRWARGLADPASRLTSLIESLMRSLTTRLPGESRLPPPPVERLSLHGKPNARWDEWLDGLAEVLWKKARLRRMLVRHVVGPDERIHRSDEAVVGRYLELVWGRVAVLMRTSRGSDIRVVLSFEVERSRLILGGPRGPWRSVLRALRQWWERRSLAAMRARLESTRLGEGPLAVALSPLAGVPVDAITKELRDRGFPRSRLAETAADLWYETDCGRYEELIEKIPERLDRDEDEGR